MLGTKTRSLKEILAGIQDEDQLSEGNPDPTHDEDQVSDVILAHLHYMGKVTMYAIALPYILSIDHIFIMCINVSPVDAINYMWTMYFVFDLFTISA